MNDAPENGVWHILTPAHKVFPVAKNLFEAGNDTAATAAVLEIKESVLLATAAKHGWVRPDEQPTEAPVSRRQAVALLREITEGSQSLAEVDVETPDHVAILNKGLEQIKREPVSSWSKSFRDLMAAELLRVPFLLRNMSSIELLEQASSIKRIVETVSLLFPVPSAGSGNNITAAPTGGINIAFVNGGTVPQELKDVTSE